VAPDWISFPLLTAVYRAALGKVNFSLFLAGQTGVFKTALAALCQQHFGTAMDDRGLPTNFASTGNALQELASTQKTRHWSWTTLPHHPIRSQ
jgi:DNA replication protein DnaC